MDLRPSTPQDRPAIIELLKKALGESFIPKSEGLWIWKHEQNPFGPSYVLLAEENKQLIGLRAFMRWQWQWNNGTYNAIRAVDTATHPEHQGKGIFKKLTMQQVAVCQEQGVHFVFNTPNEQSRPGYIKMGWVEQGKMPLKLNIKKPLSLIYSKFANKKKANQNNSTIPVQLWGSEVCDLIKSAVKSNKISTVVSPEYVSWRYANNPLFNYNYFTDHENFMLISRIKEHSFTKELRIVEFVLLKENAPNAVTTFIQKAINKFCKEHNVSFISISGQQYRIYKRFFKWMGILPVKNLGPIVTIRDLNMKDQFMALSDQTNWGYSLGDMELF